MYSDPGSPMLRRTSLGTYVLARTKGADGKKWLLLNGSGATPEGNIPFLDLFDMYEAFFCPSRALLSIKPFVCLGHMQHAHFFSVGANEN